MKKPIVILVVVALVLGLGFLAIQVTPKPMSSDLSLVNEDKPAVVLAYENFSPTGGEALARLKQIRPDYQARINFVVADIGTPDGRAFAARYRLVDGQAVILTRAKQAIAIAGPSMPEKTLRETLDAALSQDP
jgi:hypothetical protein